MSTTETKVNFGEAPIGATLRLEGTVGHKIDPVESPGSRAFYESQGSEFWGWNFAYRYYAGDGQWGTGYYSLDPNTEVFRVA